MLFRSKPRLRTPSHTTIVTVAVGFTQIVGWGTTYLMPSVLGRHIQDDIGLPAEAVFGGVTMMAAVAAFCAPRISRFVDQRGARTVMSIGSVLYAVALAVLVGLVRSRPWVGAQQPLSASLLSSMLLFSCGGVIGFGISPSTGLRARPDISRSGTASSSMRV